MASQSLYRKWRSQSFDEMVGQAEIVRTLKNALTGGKLAHAYLFTGPRGTGKTTTARLLAKTINCSNPQNGEPCNECQQCREINAGNSFNVIEIDAASNRGIDSIRDLREKVMMPPTTGKYKVYVLDEAHMLTPEAFNALLKTLEEPPPYAIFVLATTDVHKMLPTVLSRCQRFDFKRFTTRQIVKHLHFIAGQEHVKLEQAAAELIARAAAGGMRDALSLLDQAIAYSGEEITLAQVQSMLGVADPHAISKFINDVATLDSSAGLHLIHELSEAGADLRQVNAQVIEYWRSLMLARAGADIASILDLTEDELREIQQIAQLFGLEELTECARIFAQNELVQKNSGTPQLGLELAFLECIEVHRRAQAGQPVVAISTPAAQSRPSTTSVQPRAAAPSLSTQAEAPASLDVPPLQSSPQKTTRTEEQEIFASKDANGVSSPTTASASTEQDSSNSPSLTLQQVKAAWENVKRRVKSKYKMTGAMLDHYTIIHVEGTAEQAVIIIQTSSEPLYKNMLQGDRVSQVEWGLGLELGQKCRVRLVPPGQSLPASPSRDSATYSAHAATPAAPQQSAHLERSPSPAKQVEQEVVDSGMQEPPTSSHTSNGVSAQPPVARTNFVRENTIIEPPQETLEQRVRRDPIVQEAMRIFSVDRLEVRPK
jgi:DNA polymerase-3 subunit gamma/tau